MRFPFLRGDDVDDNGVDDTNDTNDICDTSDHRGSSPPLIEARFNLF